MNFVMPAPRFIIVLEIDPGLGQRIVTNLRRRMALGQIRRMGGDLVGDDPVPDIVLVRQTEVLLGRDVAQHGGAVPADHGGPDSRGDVIITGGDIGHQRAQGT